MIPTDAQAQALLHAQMFKSCKDAAEFSIIVNSFVSARAQYAAQYRHYQEERTKTQRTPYKYERCPEHFFKLTSKSLWGDIRALNYHTKECLVQQIYDLIEITWITVLEQDILVNDSVSLVPLGYYIFFPSPKTCDNLTHGLMAVLSKRSEWNRYNEVEQRKAFHKIYEVFSSLSALGGYCITAAAIWQLCWSDFHKWWKSDFILTTPLHEAPKHTAAASDTTAPSGSEALNQVNELRREWGSQGIKVHDPTSIYTRRLSDLFQFHNVDQWYEHNGSSDFITDFFSYMEAEWWTRFHAPNRHYISLRISGKDEFPLRLVLPSAQDEHQLIGNLINALKDLRASAKLAPPLDSLSFVYDAFHKIHHEILKFTEELEPPQGVVADVADVPSKASLQYYQTILIIMETTKHHAFKECFAERLARSQTKAIAWSCKGSTHMIDGLR